MTKDSLLTSRTLVLPILDLLAVGHCCRTRLPGTDETEAFRACLCVYCAVWPSGVIEVPSLLW